MDCSKGVTVKFWSRDICESYPSCNCYLTVSPITFIASSFPFHALQCSASASVTMLPLALFPPLYPSLRGSSLIRNPPPHVASLISTNRLFSTHASHRPQVPLCLATSPSSITINPLPTALPLDLLPKISTHPSLASLQLRNGPRDTYNPSHRVRKRRHGFLSRLRTRKGRMTLNRRKSKRRSTLSH